MKELDFRQAQNLLAGSLILSFYRFLLLQHIQMPHRPIINEIIDLGVMVPAETIVQKAIEEKVDIIGLSGLITPSLEEMAHVAVELQRAGLDIPIMVGGATTSKLHTALKIAPVYGGPVIHMKDASQNALVAARLLNAESRQEFVEGINREYEELRSKNSAKQVKTVSLEEAQKNKLNLW